MVNTGPCHLRVAKTLLRTQNRKLLKNIKTLMLLVITVITILNCNIRPFQTRHKKYTLTSLSRSSFLGSRCKTLAAAVS